MELNRQEQLTLSVLGVVALVGLAAMLWQRQRAQLTIEAGAGPVQDRSWNEALRTARQVDVNTASVAELERLPGIGPALAQRIAAHRQEHGPFARPEDLTTVSGIGPKTYESLKPYLTDDSTK